MALLHDGIKQKLFDVRMVEKNLSRGMVKPSEVQATSASLPDDGANAEYIALEDLEKWDGRNSKNLPKR